MKTSIKHKLMVILVEFIPAVFGLASFIHWIWPNAGSFRDCFILGMILVYVLKYQHAAYD